MAFWIEIRCERRGTDCLSNDNAGPMADANDSMGELVAMGRALCREAKQQGWHRTRDGWVCPRCLKAEQETSS